MDPIAEFQKKNDEIDRRRAASRDARIAEARARQAAKAKVKEE